MNTFFGWGGCIDTIFFVGSCVKGGGWYFWEKKWMGCTSDSYNDQIVILLKFSLTDSHLFNGSDSAQNPPPCQLYGSFI